jgi:radical SAM superfamily enzyme YgiQ (UPF0313 family)
MSLEFKVLLIYPNTMMATLIPMSISNLYSSLKENGVTVKLFDTTYYRTEEKSFEDRRVELLQIRKFDLSEGGVQFKETDIYEDLHNMVADFHPDLIGITLVEDTYPLGLKLLKSIRDFSIPVIAGGVLVNFFADELISEKCIDMLCVGEGEEALVDLCQAMAKGWEINNIPNLWVKQGDGTVVKNPVRDLVNLDRLPFIDFDVFESTRMCRPMQGQLYIMLHVEMQRGCPFDCTYCAAPALRGFYERQGCRGYFREKSPHRLIQELEHLMHKYKPNYINFNAESFLAMKTNSFMEFTRLYTEKIGLPFWCQTRLETVTDEKIKMLKSMNCANMQFGIEQGNEEFRKKMLNRKISNERILEAIRIVEKYEIPYTVNNIIGFPGETRELIFDTINLNRQLNPTSINCYMFTPYRGTWLRDYCVKHDYLDPDASTMQSLDGADIRYDTITKEELYGLQRTFNLYVRLPESDYGLIKKAEKFDDEGNEIFQFLSNIYREKYFS